MTNVALGAPAHHRPKDGKAVHTLRLSPSQAGSAEARGGRGGRPSRFARPRLCAACAPRPATITTGQGSVAAGVTGGVLLTLALASDRDHPSLGGIFGWTYPDSRRCHGRRRMGNPSLSLL